ncbi:hypothetical protein KIPB_001637 [Kipferlia bialata]|uniref:TM2 domain-containing protein n=1 Tax=Kipferlia bialata TaxID=797122 RepID=A0A9K3CR28_9EUKA|nr:hypothetical protein KIPB_001637 [Kipferlia bialata]|eukprot:g1637.t1
MYTTPLPTQRPPPKEMWIAYVIWFFFGTFGFHRHYIAWPGVSVPGTTLTVLAVASCILKYVFYRIRLALYLGTGIQSAIGIWWLIDACLIPTLVNAANLQTQGPPVKTAIVGGVATDYPSYPPTMGQQPPRNAVLNSQPMPQPQPPANPYAPATGPNPNVTANPYPSAQPNHYHPQQEQYPATEGPFVQPVTGYAPAPMPVVPTYDAPPPANGMQ